MIIGITGPSGGGKSTVTAALGNSGYKIIDADKIAHDVTKSGECLDKLKNEFGEDIISSSGELIRKELAGIVFCDKEKLQKLNEITHYYIIKRMKDELCRYINENADVVMDVPLLFEAELDKLCDVTLAAVARRDVITNRIMKRDNISAGSAESRLQSQHGNEYYTDRADYVIDTTDGYDAVGKEIAVFLNKLASGEIK